jgi:hypothetical protein
MAHRLKQRTLIEQDLMDLTNRAEGWLYDERYNGKFTPYSLGHPIIKGKIQWHIVCEPFEGGQYETMSRMS